MQPSITICLPDSLFILSTFFKSSNVTFNFILSDNQLTSLPVNDDPTSVGGSNHYNVKYPSSILSTAISP